MKSQKILILCFAAFAFLACGSKTTENKNENAPLSGGGNVVNSNVNLNANLPANSNSNNNSEAKSADNSPQRIAFNKGANWGAVNITLAPGAAKKFVVGAKSGQSMQVETSSKETSVNLIKGKAETTEDFGFLNAELQTNGDYIFEVKNSTKKEIKTSVKVTIEGGAAATKKSGEDSAADEEKSSDNEN